MAADYGVAWLFGARPPLFPQSTANKMRRGRTVSIQVAFTMPLLGDVLSHGRLLESPPTRAVE